MEGDLKSRHNTNYKNRINTMIDTESGVNAYKPEKKDSMNRTFYSFGGRTPIKAAFDH